MGRLLRWYCLALLGIFSLFYYSFAQNYSQNNAELIASLNEVSTDIPPAPFSFNWRHLVSIEEGGYRKNMQRGGVPLPQPYIREADVLWSKRIWRSIDTRAATNKRFNNADYPFAELMYDLVMQHPEVRIFTDDTFTEAASREQLQNRFTGFDTVAVYNFATQEYDWKPIERNLQWKDFVQFRLKEDWVFESKHSNLDVRIIGIAPVREVIDETGVIRGQEALFWVYYDDIRPLLAQYDAPNPDGEESILSWADFLDMGYFGSRIVKEDNVYDRNIAEYATGRNALEESHRIKRELYEREHNQWEY
ncbi:MAG: gliding motility protein GldN [Sphingobacteriales bacterium]|nr:gliding motility protein GldN [Sphingobacteriales bacterium]